MQPMKCQFLCVLGKILRFIMKGLGVAAILVLIVTAFVSIVRVDSGRVPAPFTGKVEDVVDSPSTQTESVRKARGLKDFIGSAKKIVEQRLTHMGKTEVAEREDNWYNHGTETSPFAKKRSQERQHESLGHGKSSGV